MNETETHEIFKFYPTHQQPIGLISIPHSGEEIPQEFNEFIIGDFDILSRDVDTGVHQLIDIKALNKAGISVIKANIHRIVIDLNRAQDQSMLNWKKNSHGEDIVIKEPTPELKHKMEIKYHAPYYEMLKALLNELSKSMHKASFVDLHSMPGTATDYHLKINPKQDKHRPDFCLSDVLGESCDENYIQEFKSQFDQHYKNVNINNPYFGGNVTREINKIFPHINNIQIEISRALYLDEKNRIMLDDKVAILRDNLTKILIKSFQKLA